MEKPCTSLHSFHESLSVTTLEAENQRLRSDLKRAKSHIDRLAQVVGKLESRVSELQHANSALKNTMFEMVRQLEDSRSLRESEIDACEPVPNSPHKTKTSKNFELRSQSRIPPFALTPELAYSPTTLCDLPTVDRSGSDWSSGDVSVEEVQYQLMRVGVEKERLEKQLSRMLEKESTDRTAKRWS